MPTACAHLSCLVYHTSTNRPLGRSSTNWKLWGTWSGGRTRAMFGQSWFFRPSVAWHKCARPISFWPPCNGDTHKSWGRRTTSGSSVSSSRSPRTSAVTFATSSPTSDRFSLHRPSTRLVLVLSRGHWRAARFEAVREVLGESGGLVTYFRDGNGFPNCAPGGWADGVHARNDIIVAVENLAALGAGYAEAEWVGRDDAAVEQCAQ